MGNPAEFEARLSKAEADAVAARHMAAAHDREIANLGVKVDAVRRTVNALGEQTRSQFDRVWQELADLRAEMRTEFADVRAEMRTGFAMTATGMQHIVDLITPLVPPEQR